MANKIMNRQGEWLKDDQTAAMRFLYQTILGRCILKILISPIISKAVGSFLNTRFSTFLIAPFIQKNKIDMKEYKKVDYLCYNEFFTREIKEGARLIEENEKLLFSPCDSKVTYYKIEKNKGFKIKNSVYTVEDLLEDVDLAKQYENGTILIFRLSVDDYHRYCYVDSGKKVKSYFIKGKLHTVNPIASYYYKIYKTNSRHVDVLDMNDLGEMIYIEVGAMMVGKIKNLEVKSFKRGDIKGWFEFGGSTVVLLFKENTVQIDEDIIENSNKEIETKVKMGEKIGEILRKDG